MAATGQEDEKDANESNAGSVEIALDFEIDKKDGQEEINKFGFYFNSKGICLSLENDQRPPKQFASFELFEEFGALIEKYTLYLLEKQFKLLPVTLQSLEKKKQKKKKADKTVMYKLYEPKIDESKIEKCTIFMSPDYQTNESLLLLIPGTGSVRSGQWSRSVCINDSLAAGSMLSYVSRAVNRNKWSVFLCDPNGRMSNGRRAFSDHHLLFVYDVYIKPYLYDEAQGKGIKNVYVVCHSAAGIALTRLLHDRESVLPCIAGIAGTDTDFGRAKTEKVKQVMKERVINFRCSYEPKDKVLSEKDEFPKRVSAGHHEHIYSSASAFESVFAFFEQMKQ